ncbi:MAG TPA: hypothetical protein VES20_09890, partial [Bryobacteraceae bacterium]|nr:hypothetical protein [Bryobacteraceae bacterium]
VNSQNASNPTNTVNVTLTVTSVPTPTGLAIYNAATGLSRGVSPGLFVTIFGRNIAPATALETRVANGLVQTELGGVRVTFDGVAAPLTYVGPSGDRTAEQINAIVPYAVSGRATTRMVVEYRGGRSEPLELVVREVDPGIFNRAGQGAILNQDNSVNAPATPAARGTVVQVYATGEGLSAPAPQTGQVITAGSVPRPLLPVSARVNGQPASVEYAGAVPGLAAGVLQVNVRIPENLSLAGPAQVPIDIMIGTSMSQTGVTVAVRP